MQYLKCKNDFKNRKKARTQCMNIRKYKNRIKTGGRGGKG